MTTPRLLRTPIGGKNPRRFFHQVFPEQELEAQLTTNPDDHEALFRLALRKVVAQDYETAMELLLKLMQKDRKFGDDAGRRTLLKVFELLGDDPQVSRYRRRMASLLY